ncbi:hypothetical protein CW735_02805 [Alteromonas sp. MB-3u-76]|uniref:hypothetical protein n=1 Tax=unclassified Alteromonas TaxID=2614992 RepID=UPI000903B2BA|nr:MULTISPECIES: hypothetical protein [unclassified Alteromonas]APE04855.1 hypothetical protein BM528_02940 [Alteromonas sp. RW2A1]AUC87256.1 hypothetical protein CW735_02805 [Alteromonas sp. MB-3u-76]
MRLFSLLLFSIFMFSCSDRPTFEGLVKNYQVNSEVFSELTEMACKLDKSDTFKRYTPRKTGQESIVELDVLLNKVSGKYVDYRSGKDSQCILEVLVYAEGFAGMGKKYSYTYQIDSPKTFDKKVHAYNNIISSAENTSFDMPLIASKKFDGWYFSFVYNHES